MGGVHELNKRMAPPIGLEPTTLRFAVSAAAARLGRGLVGKGLPQLLHDPPTSGMAGDVEVQNAAAVVTDDEEAIKQTEVQRGDGENPSLLWRRGDCAEKLTTVLPATPHPAGNGDLGYVEAQHEEFAVDTGRTPSGDSRRPSGRSTHESAWRLFGRRRSVSAPGKAWSSTV